MVKSSNPIQAAVEKIPVLSRCFLEHTYVGKSHLSLPELLLEALRKLPQTGTIWKYHDLEAIEAVSWLFPAVTMSDGQRETICSLYLDAVSRRIKRRQEKKTRPIKQPPHVPSDQ